MGRRRTAGISAADERAPLGCGGSVLAELLVATLLFGIVGACALAFMRGALTSLVTQEAEAEAGGTAALVAAVWAQEMRVAGFGASGSGPAPVRLATSTAVEVAADLDGDGATDGPHERVAYAYDTGRAQLTRATAGGTPQPFLVGIPPGGARFRYFDAAGAELPVPPAGLAPADRERVRAVRLDLALRVPGGTPLVPALEVPAWVTTTVHLRNP